MGGARRDRLELALELGVAPRRLEGWEPLVVTRYEYDGDRLVGSVTEREPEWSRADVEALDAIRQARAMVGPHGYPMDVAMSPEGDRSSWESKYEWVVGPPVVDHAQAALDRTIAAYKKKYPNAEMGALRWRVEKRMVA